VAALSGTVDMSHQAEQLHHQLQEFANGITRSITTPGRQTRISSRGRTRADLLAINHWAGHLHASYCDTKYTGRRQSDISYLIGHGARNTRPGTG